MHSQAYIGAIKDVFTVDGVLKHVNTICINCTNYFKKIKIPGKNDTDISIEDNQEPNHPNDRGEALLKTCLLAGLFPGPIPDCLAKLTPIEISMISIYCPVTKLKLQGGKHHHSEDTTYTIINEIHEIAKSLPVMPTRESFAYLKHVAGEKNMMHMYRPFYVKAALKWLKENNPLYNDIEILFPTGKQSNAIQQ